MTKAIILAGGRATRLGPLTAQLNKALVSVGQRPMIAHQLELLRNAGVDETVVVVSPKSYEQVVDVIERSHVNMAMKVRFAVQKKARGPVDAVLTGAVELLGTAEDDASVYVIMADTFIDETLPPIDISWVGVAPAPATRSWCYPVDASYQEGKVDEGTLVCIGVYGFNSLTELHSSANLALSEMADMDEVPMAPLLWAYDDGDPKLNVKMKSWLDVGDVKALTHARRQRFITRSFNRLSLTDHGILVKSGDMDKLTPEMKFYEAISDGYKAQMLFPRYLGPTARRDGYMMEYVDLPSLAELYLYWPGRPDMWAGIVEEVVGRVRGELWGRGRDDEGLKVDWHNDMYVHKVWKRLKTYEESGNVIAWPVVDKLGEYLSQNLAPTMVCGHGDLNFGNILYGLGSGVIKLVDPRGDLWVDRDYELAKLRYSYRDGFSAICHNLFELTDDGVVIGPNRVAEAEAIDRVLLDLSNLRRITAVEATIFLSAAPLHDEPQGRAMYVQGIKLAMEALDDGAW